MSREVTEAHYLHERHGLEAVLRPPVGYPTALAWVPKREELVVATRDGTLHSVDPVLGTRIVAKEVGEAAALDVHPDRKRYLVVARGGKWQVGQMGGEVTHSGKHPFLGRIDAFFFGEKYVIMVGNAVEKRYLLIFVDGELKKRIQLPKGVIVLPVGKKLLLARSNASGLEIVPVGPGMKFGKIPTTGHVLQRAHSHVLGMTQTGVAIWTHEGGSPQSMRMPELTAGDVSKDGKMLGLGTRHGAVALAKMDMLTKRANPDLVKAFEFPVTTVSFSDRGRWLATGGDRLQIWTWED